MPNAAPRLCPGNCGREVTRGRCATCTAKAEKTRGTAAQRGYGPFWVRWRPTFIGMLVALGILPVCGAALPDGPQTEDSQCKAQGWLTFTSQDGTGLHLDHEPALLPEERQDRTAICNPQRIQLLCASCHAAKQSKRSCAA